MPGAPPHSEGMDMGFSFKNLLEKIVQVGGKLGWVVQALIGTVGPKLSSGDLGKVLVVCDAMDRVAEQITDFTAKTRLAASDKQLTVDEIAQLMDELTQIATAAHAAETAAYQ